jgi:hypothetical protein
MKTTVDTNAAFKQALASKAVREIEYIPLDNSKRISILPATDATNEDSRQILALLKEHTNLLALSLSHIGNATVEQFIIPAINSNKSLKILNLSNSYITISAIELIFNALTVNEHITHLILQDLPLITPDNILKIISGLNLLKNNKTLQTVYISNQYWNPSAVTSYAKQIEDKKLPLSLEPAKPICDLLPEPKAEQINIINRIFMALFNIVSDTEYWTEHTQGLHTKPKGINIIEQFLLTNELKNQAIIERAETDLLTIILNKNIILFIQDVLKKSSKNRSPKTTELYQLLLLLANPSSFEKVLNALSSFTKPKDYSALFSESESEIEIPENDQFNLLLSIKNIVNAAYWSNKTITLLSRFFKTEQLPPPIILFIKDYLNRILPKEQAPHIPFSEDLSHYYLSEVKARIEEDKNIKNNRREDTLRFCKIIKSLDVLSTNAVIISQELDNFHQEMQEGLAKATVMMPSKKR